MSSGRVHDVAIVGGGPAGLAAATAAAMRGLEVVLFERQRFPVDKTCGEGVMPAGLRVLEELGVRARIPASGFMPFRGIRYVQEDGASVEGRFEGEGGWGIRRTALSGAMVARAREVGVVVREGVRVERHERRGDHVALLSGDEVTRARMLVAADGVHSPLRRAEGLQGAPQPFRRYGMRRHFRLKPWTDLVEVHFAEAVEAYVTPCGPEQVGMAFLWEDPRPGRPVRWPKLMASFPLLARRLEGAEPASAIRGGGPFWQVPTALVRDRFALLGDAAGYVDALSGEGISLGLVNALALARVLPDALARGAQREALLPYELAALQSFHAYERLTRALLLLARRPRLRRAAIQIVRRVPRLFEELVRAAVG